jgi:hypothetical protein
MVKWSSSQIVQTVEVVQVVEIAYSGPNQPPIPFQASHPFQNKPATYSSGSRPLIPEQAGHPVKRYSDAG